MGPHHAPTASPKSVAIIGAGSGGLAMLKALLDLPLSLREGWEIVLYEEREDVGGIWLPDPRGVTPPELPETPLYPLLRTNTPVPFMTYPGFPFTEGTPLFPSHEYVQTYHARYADELNLRGHIRFHHRLEKAAWEGPSKEGFWNLTISDRKKGVVQTKTHDHLVIASGNNHIPHIPTWEGQDEWLANSPPGGLKRRLIHSIYYREPEEFTGQSVLIVGNGASGRDASTQLEGLAREVFISIRHEDQRVVGQIKPEIHHFSATGVVFVDGTFVNPDVVLLATGYEHRKPFLEETGLLQIDRSARDNSSSTNGLVSNTRYIFPLHQHILSLSPEYPTNALAFVGLPSAIPNCASDLAQSLFATYAIAHPEILPSRSEMLAELARHEDEVRSLGYDPYTVGHRMLTFDMSSGYQDDLVDFLKKKGVIRDDGKKFVEQWRRDVFTYKYIVRGWKHIEELGVGDEWVRGVETEEQWANVMRRVNEWQKEYEEANGIEFVSDWSVPGVSS
ncbi:hypothetical protein NLJ89_g2488 [Agrocybe chaxingu]|uniref:FAD/NAD(P)-binding domain-containing protein n=1 Tax=Agrocybe chaxingu TaxID=84603 RepID=A0A9W8K5T3_9AGAR|nr:hypothetical protein NLJ89_g2488 [Agrocybe chaxingu]